MTESQTGFDFDKADNEHAIEKIKANIAELKVLRRTASASYELQEIDKEIESLESLINTYETTDEDILRAAGGTALEALAADGIDPDEYKKLDQTDDSVEKEGE